MSQLTEHSAVTDSTPPPIQTNELAPVSTRLQFIDLARAVTTLQMILGHGLHALLDGQWTHNRYYEAWTFVRGFTSAMFLFMAGFCFSIATVPSWQHHRRFGKPFVRRISRFVVFIALGYLIHLPVRRISDFSALTPAEWQMFLRVNVLQLIGLMLIALQIGTAICSTPRIFARISFMAALAVVCLSPLMDGINWSRYVAKPIAAYLYAGTGSIFPVFGWGAFILMGAALAIWMAPFWQKQQTPNQTFEGPSLRLVGLLLAVGMGIVGLGHALKFAVPALSESLLIFPAAKPHFVFNRVGIAVFLLGIFSLTCRFIKDTPVWARAISQESLVIYIAHLFLIYGSTWWGGLRQWVGPTLHPIPAIMLIIVIQLIMALLAVHYSQLKKTQPRRVRVIRWIIILGALVSLIG